MTLLCFENEQPTAELARATVLQGRRDKGGGELNPLQILAKIDANPLP